MSHVCILVHIVISTYNREMVIGTDHADNLYKYMGGIIKNNRCKLLAINGIPNHIHILVDLHPQVTLAGLMMDLKKSTNVWMKSSGLFPLFKKWGDGYFASSLSYSHKDSAIKYIMGQREHHKSFRFDDEFDRLILKNGLTLYRYPDQADQ